MKTNGAQNTFADGRVRILHVEYGVGFGGAIVSLAELVRELNDIGKTESVVATFLDDSILRGLFPTNSTVKLRPFISYMTRLKTEHFFLDHAVVAWLRWPAMKAYALIDSLHERYLSRMIERTARRVNAAVIHSNNLWAPSALKAAHRLQIPCVVHFRGFEEPQTSDIQARHGSWVLKSLRRVIGVSKAVSENAKAFGVPHDKIVTIYDHVNMEPFLKAADRRLEIRTTLDISAEKFVVGVFGRIVAWKGQLEFLNGIQSLFPDCPNLHVLVIGDESDSENPEYSDAVRQFARDPVNAGRVTLGGYQNDVPPYYAACDAVVHCSTEPEPFGRVVIEGMASGKPVIAMAEGGPLEIIADNVDGLLVPPRDGAAMRAAIRTLYADEALRDRLAANAVQTVRVKFAPRPLAEQFLAALAESTDPATLHPVQRSEP